MPPILCLDPLIAKTALPCALALDAERNTSIPALLARERVRVEHLREQLSAGAPASVLEADASALLAALRAQAVSASVAAAARLDAHFRSTTPELLDRACVPEGFKAIEIRNLDRMHRVYGNYDRWARLLERLVVTPRAKLHDLAAGNGGFYRFLAEHRAAEHGWSLTSSDLDARSVEAGRRSASAAGHAVRFEQRDATALDDLRDQVDLFTVTAAAHHLTPGLLLRLCAGAASVAREGVVLIDPVRSARVAAVVFGATALDPRTWANLPDAVQSVRRVYMPAEVALLCQAAGLRVTSYVEPPFFTAVHVQRA